jgi:uncharacterized protein with beta-barrel porin domain
MQIVRERMEKMGGPAYQGTNAGNYFWATPYGYTAQQNANGAPSASYGQNTGGFAFGADTLIGANSRIGAAIILQTSSLNGQNVETQDGLTTASYQIAAYAKQKVASATNLNLIANLALDQNNSSRLDRTDSIYQTATASYKGWHGLLSGEIDHKYVIKKNTLSPIVRFDYGYVRVGGYNETGAGIANLAVNSQTQSSAIGSLGFKYRYDINDANRLLLRVMGGYDFAAKPASLTATDGTGTTFTTLGNNPGSFVMQGGVGYEMQAKDKTRIRINYDYFGRNASYSNSLINLSLIRPL